MTVQRTLLACGEHAVLVEVDELRHVLTFTHAVREAIVAEVSGFSGIIDIVPAAKTVLVIVDGDVSIASVRQALATLPVTADAKLPLSDQLIEIPVRYDGPDLPDVAELTGMSVPEIVAAHTGTDWRVAFGGFAPGFAYLTLGDPRLAVPRRQQPRTSVPAGSVGLAGEFSAIYPRSSPGGWQLIGHTDAIVFDVAQEPPALLQPGMRVRFVASKGNDAC
jgi:KipI family sensor histidine kinase inhibitor